jgi:hypothetical protein
MTSVDIICLTKCNTVLLQSKGLGFNLPEENPLDWVRTTLHFADQFSYFIWK